ncbi:hypothetical protein N7488_003911 [Penicillium malachiteum]|nr:hypothetical protein N7488_003911 [Penicillium malachiteum]
MGYVKKTFGWACQVLGIIDLRSSNCLSKDKKKKKKDSSPTGIERVTFLPIEMGRKEGKKHQKIDRRRGRTCNLLIRSQAPCHWASRPACCKILKCWLYQAKVKMS